MTIKLCHTLFTVWGIMDIKWRLKKVRAILKFFHCMIENTVETWSHCRLRSGGNMLQWYKPVCVTENESSSPRWGKLATSLLTTQYSGRSRRRSASSGRSAPCIMPGSQEVRPNANAPTYMGSVARTCITTFSPSWIGRAVNTYPWQNSVSVRLAIQRSLLSLMLRPRVL